jgi:tetratricopeptide (TPR) repeat protein
MPRRVKTALAALLGLSLLISAGWFFSNHVRKSARKSAIRDALADRDLALADRLLTEYLRHEDDDAAAHLLAAQTARRLDDVTSANQHLNRYRELGGDPEGYQMELVLRGCQSGNLSGASGAMKFCIEQPNNPAVPLMLEALTRGYLAANRPAAAVEVTDVWLKRNPAPGERAYVLYLRGRGFELQAKIPDAVACYRDALGIRPQLHECTFALAEVLRRESPTEALSYYEQLREAGYKPADVTVGTAGCLRQLGELDRASALIAPMVAEQPSNVTALVEAAKVDLDRLRPGDAEPRLKRALQLAPKHRDALAQLVRCLRALGRDTEAKEQSEKLRLLDEELFKSDGKTP